MKNITVYIFCTKVLKLLSMEIFSLGLSTLRNVPGAEVASMYARLKLILAQVGGCYVYEMPKQ